MNTKNHFGAKENQMIYQQLKKKNECHSDRHKKEGRIKYKEVDQVLLYSSRTVAFFTIVSG